MVRRHTVTPHTRVSSRGRVLRIPAYTRGTWVPASGEPLGALVHLSPRFHALTMDEQKDQTAAFTVLDDMGSLRFKTNHVYLVGPPPSDIHAAPEDIVAHENLHQVLNNLEGFSTAKSLDRLVNYGTLRRGRQLRGGI